MKKEDIKRMAKEVGFDVKWFEQSQPGYPALPREGMLFAFAELVAKAEREECAKLAQKTVSDTHLSVGIKTPKELFFSVCLSIGAVTALVVVMVLMA